MAQDVARNLAEHRLRRSDTPMVDLTGVTNPYGPPPAALDALRSLTADDVAVPARAAGERLVAAYAAALDVDPAQLIAGRGPADFLGHLGGTVAHESVAVPLPASDDVLDVFPSRGFSRYPGEQVPSVEQVEAALEAASLVVVSNPQLPSGVVFDRAALDAAARRHPASTLVVDESAVDFLPDPASTSLVGTDADNVVVLRSPAGFYGIAATCTGVAWSRDPLLLRSLFGRREPAPVSGLDVVVAEAALASTEWAAESRRRLAADAAWLDEVLPALGGRAVADRRLPYRFVLTDSAVTWATRLAGDGISVRALGPGHGVHPGAVGLFAPKEADRPVLATALGVAHAAHPAFSEAG